MKVLLGRDIWDVDEEATIDMNVKCKAEGRSGE